MPVAPELGSSCACALVAGPGRHALAVTGRIAAILVGAVAVPGSPRTAAVDIAVVRPGRGRFVVRIDTGVRGYGASSQSACHDAGSCRNSQEGDRPTAREPFDLIEQVAGSWLSSQWEISPTRRDAS